MTKEHLEFLLSYKKKHTLTWDQLADKIGTTRMSLYRWREKGTIEKKVYNTIIENFITKEKLK